MKPYVPTPDIIREWLDYIYWTYGMTYREISAYKPFQGFTPGSLSAFRLHGRMTREMKRRWDPTPRARALREPTIEISKRDPRRAARSIRNNVHYDVDELVKELEK